MLFLFAAVSMLFSIETTVARLSKRSLLAIAEIFSALDQMEVKGAKQHQKVFKK